MKIRKVNVSEDFWKFAKHRSIETGLTIPAVTQSIIEQIKDFERPKKKAEGKDFGF